MRRRIALVEFSPSGGLFQFSFQLGQALAERGHDVELVTGRDPELRSRVPGLRVLPLLPTWHPSAGVTDVRLWRKARRAFRAMSYLAAWWRVLRYVSRSQPDVVQLSGWRFPLDGWVVAQLARRRRRPRLVYVAHAPRPQNEQRPGAELFKSGTLLTGGMALGYRSVDAVIALGERTAEEVRTCYPRAASVEVIPHGDENVFLDGVEYIKDVAQTEPSALFFGSLRAYKGLDVLLEAFDLVRSHLPQARLHIVGAPSGEIDLNTLGELAAQIGNVDIRAEYVPVPEVAGVVERARLVVTPYRHANASGVAALALAFARPVIATDTGDLAAAVEHERSGLLVPVDDVEALAKAMEDLLTDPDRAERLGRYGQRRQVDVADWSVIAARVDELYARLAGCSRAGSA
jgi:glycosyltransferase involved in cell wall biosynthesis